jgi:excisionase family DNA binding protein
MEINKNPNTINKKRFLRVNNVVRRIGVPERTVRQWAATGRLRAIRGGKKIWLFDPDVIEAFILQKGGL